ncbi:probable WRKY transcription factor 20 isoform X2 [Andrographis paniculata]|uniref:probable WRKY transcription factor 20 isoform X2 n=1 Tax=Andrographis paniculata TaxID=175694 RepID=UPI0021E837AC|nr:probable WRKY transcription factor 20 isoform X2 [Andrographis paniculata]
MAEFKETPKTVIARPVPCRPSLSCPNRFQPPPPPPDQLNSITNSPFSETQTETETETSAAAVIRPRTLRLVKPVESSNVVEAKDHRSEEFIVGSNVVYRPIAKVVSRKAVSLLANLGGGQGIGSRQDIIDPTGASIQQSTHDNPEPFQLPFEASNADVEDNGKTSMFPQSGDPSDNHSWRKYGQKHVKGSKNPRSYYKCAHPNCPVKKKVEKTLDSRIAEIVYSGEHNHSKPQLVDYFTNAPRQEFDEARNIVRNLTHVNLQDGSAPALSSTSNDSRGGFEEANESLDSKFRSCKRTRCGSHLPGALSEPRPVLHNTADSDNVGDGFRWRKYGQKVVRGNPYPRAVEPCKKKATVI